MTRAWLIGAGPGDIELMTLKATRALAMADVVLTDELVNPQALDFARKDALIVHVGKRGGATSTPQAEIIATMLAHLRAGRSVARLKGGDPFVFGRGGEERLALQAEGIAVEVISGVTAGIAAPASIGIPITHRGLAQGAIFVTGHGASEDQPDWAALARTGMTLVIYMGMRRLDEIVASLVRAGMASDTPCAVIESATLPAQRHLVAALATLHDEVARTRIGSPSIVVIGKVAALADAAMPRTYALGIGCKRGVTVEQIARAVAAQLDLHHVMIDDITHVATLDTKADEPALIDFCAQYDLTLAAYSKAEIDACFSANLDTNDRALQRSATVQQHVNVDGVCEPCALLAAAPGALIGEKLSLDGVSVALAVRGPWPASSFDSTQTTP